MLNCVQDTDCCSYQRELQCNGIRCTTSHHSPSHPSRPPARHAFSLQDLANKDARQEDACQTSRLAKVPVIDFASASAREAWQITHVGLPRVSEAWPSAGSNAPENTEHRNHETAARAGEGAGLTLPTLGM